MISLIFIILMLAVFGKMFGLAIKMTWGIVKVVFSLVFLPIFLIALVVAGLLYVALPILVVIGIIAFISSATAKA
ncbi:MAG TPA: hypothetical protein DCG85_05470 [Lachnospiraceae bacterium]|nr:hypothetical protein [Lachnospiraceae bacterium]